VTGRVAVVRAVLSTARQDIVVTGWSGRNLAIREAREYERPAVCCDYLAAEVTRDGVGRCDIADVIIWREGQLRPTVAWVQLADALRRWPGCAVAAAGAGSGACQVADRYGSVTSIAVGGRDCPPGLCIFASASFVHGWLCAGWPLAVLNPELQVVVSRGWSGWDAPAQGVAVSCSLAVAGTVPVS
jgi:hypothetical protein